MPTPPVPTRVTIRSGNQFAHLSELSLPPEEPRRRQWDVRGLLPFHSAMVDDRRIKFNTGHLDARSAPMTSLVLSNTAGSRPSSRVMRRQQRWALRGPSSRFLEAGWNPGDWLGERIPSSGWLSQRYPTYLERLRHRRAELRRVADPRPRARASTDRCRALTGHSGWPTSWLRVSTNGRSARSRGTDHSARRDDGSECRSRRPFLGRRFPASGVFWRVEEEHPSR